MAELGSLVGPFILLLLLTFGLLLAVLGVFLVVLSRGKPRTFGAGFLGCGITVILALLAVIMSGAFMGGVNLIMDVFVPGLIYVAALAIGAVLAIVPFLLVAIRT